MSYPFVILEPSALKSKPAHPKRIARPTTSRADGEVVVAAGGGVTIRDGDDEVVGGPMLDHQQRGPKGLAPRASLSSQLF